MELDTLKLLRTILEQGPIGQQIGHLDMHFSDTCNLRCHYCSYTQRENTITVDENVLEAALRHEPIYVCVIGTGEPALAGHGPTGFASLMARFPKRRCVFMITNGTVMPRDFTGVADRFDFVRISLDAATPETYERMKGVNLFDAAMKNVRAYLEAGVPTIGVSFVVETLNVHEVPVIAEILAPIFYAFPGRFFLKYRRVCQAPQFLPSNNSVADAFSELCRLRDNSSLLRTFIESATNYEVIPSLCAARDAVLPEAPFCYCSLLCSLVKTSGDIYPCCTMGCKGMNCLGNIARDPWEAICERRWEFAHERAGRENPQCTGCMDDAKNQILHEALGSKHEFHPSLTRVSGIGSLFSQW